MTARNRNKNNLSEKTASSTQDDVAKKSPKPSSNGSPSIQGSGSGSWVKVIAALCYIALVAAAGFAAIYLQQVLKEVHQISSRNEETVRKNAEVAHKVENVLQQVDNVRRAVDGLESALGTMRAEQEMGSRAVRKGEAETRRVEEALQRLQNELLVDLSEGIKEVKEARERDFSSLEKTVEERLAELSASIAASVTEFTETQGETQSQLADLKARLDDMEDPELIRQELSAIVDTVAGLSATKQATDESAYSLREQIAAVGSELQTRNQEIASMSQEVEAVRLLVQETAGSLRQQVSGAEAGIQALTDQDQSLQSSLELATEALHSLEKELRGESARAEQRSDGLEVRLKVVEEGRDSLVASLTDLTSKVEALLAKYDSHESTLAAQGTAAEKARATLQGELEELKGSLGELQSNVVALSDAQTNLASRVSNLGLQIEGLEQKLEALGEVSKSTSHPPPELEKLKSTVDGLVVKAAKLESHEKAIEALQGSLQKTISSLEALTKAPAE
ncbi:cytoskeleton-associated protein 4-like [Oncorhynchus tshawytscha]|uniref:Cytoskeleton-associated protein 4 n=1 Tax=Oncorhynchus tshawytscha TaxID=74940 RepID=A0A8C8EYV0_ONCTS|nr:cytoskeleton-associated protein 4-like [Oncorhynchus tshawytscha]